MQSARPPASNFVNRSTAVNLRIHPMLGHVDSAVPTLSSVARHTVAVGNLTAWQHYQIRIGDTPKIECTFRKVGVICDAITCADGAMRTPT
jgi:hypothetical protein